jgi:hypothetical protein
MELRGVDKGDVVKAEVGDLGLESAAQCSWSRWIINTVTDLGESDESRTVMEGQSAHFPAGKYISGSVAYPEVAPSIVSC